ncbi:hemolysin XhlA family protein [Hathewaya massiliensis]|uniref:hemolysin XhlA family protein n=1 Tax=Hathewaya massiliensis TaxID=1964382 RepID=UPI00115A2844|nr:hemolysin XhlA family protein [Hathewaya massiliensis]
MEKGICQERHKRIDEKIEVHERRINNHSERIDKLEQYQSKTEAKIENLCEQISSLVSTMKWFIGLLVGSFVGFFFYAIQRNLFK